MPLIAIAVVKYGTMPIILILHELFTYIFNSKYNHTIKQSEMDDIVTLKSSYG